MEIAVVHKKGTMLKIINDILCILVCTVVKLIKFCLFSFTVNFVGIY